MYDSPQVREENVLRSSIAEGVLSCSKARYYNPSVGRFVSEDPILSHNYHFLYSYVENRPTFFIDPLGLDAVCPECCTDEEIKKEEERWRKAYVEGLKPFWGPKRCQTWALIVRDILRPLDIHCWEWGSIYAPPRNWLPDWPKGLSVAPAHEAVYIKSCKTDFFILDPWLPQHPDTIRWGDPYIYKPGDWPYKIDAKVPISAIQCPN